jgi:hypothetical protein
MHNKKPILPLVSLIFLTACNVFTPVTVHAAELASAIKRMLSDRCTECHGADEKSGGLDLAALTEKFDLQRDLDAWMKIESKIIKGQMPPPEEERLAGDQIKEFAEWFEGQFVSPGGVQHAGPSHPRRLSREELQNTLEDILYVDIRATVTNSRLHVIPDTVIEKFFSAGVVGKSGFSNDAITLSKESVDIQTYARCLALVISLLDSSERAREQILGSATLPKDISTAAVRQIIRQFSRSAYRRPPTAEELDALIAVYEKMAKERPAYEAIKSALLATLLSPPFLYRFEESKPGQTPVVGDELAVRLSYFLWSAPPDATLLELAANGKLREPDVLKQQVRRMLADPKRIALSENLGGEWFDYKRLRQQSAVNKRSDKMAGFYRTQYEEALLFFDSIIRFDQPFFSVVDADWSYINGHQSNIYRLSTVKKTFSAEGALPPINIHYRHAVRQIRKANYEYKHAPLAVVRLNDPNRGGFVTLGPTMSVTSTENRTSPIRRGVYVMERILGEHFEQPKDVPDLEATQKKAQSQKLNLSHNEILKLHSSQKGCAACHQYIDPIGFGLEMFDQLGISRNVTVPNPSGETLNWTPKQTPKSYADQSWTLTKPLVAGAETRVFFQYTQGRHRLDIKNVRLESGDHKLIDKHFGFTGKAKRDNVWFFSIPKDAPANGWRLTAEVQGSRGTDSNGTITVSGPNDKHSGYKLPNGKSFASPAELKKLLLTDYQEQITDNAIRRVLAYALGRKIEPVDRPAIKKIKEAIKTKAYRMTALIEAVVLSYPFRNKESR